MEQEDRVRALEAQVAELTERLEDVAPTSSRRHMLRNAALAAGGAVAATVVGTAGNVAAAEVFDLGLVNDDADKTTANFIPLAATTGGNGFLFQAGDVFSTDASAFPAAVAAWTTLANWPTGLYAYTSSTGVGQAVAAIGVGPESLGIRVTGVQANALFTPLGVAAPARTDAHALGELVEDSTGALWKCVVAGTPGTWRKLAGPTTAGSLHVLAAPARVYDSRSPAPAQGKLLGGANRTVSLADGRDATSGAVIAANIVPAGAVAVLGNLTVTETEGSLGGFLSVVPGDAAAASGSSVNWFGPNQNIANALVARVDASRQVRVFAGGAAGAGAHFVIDVTGYYL